MRLTRGTFLAVRRRMRRTYILRVGLYVPETGERLALADGSEYVELPNVVVP